MDYWTNLSENNEWNSSTKQLYCELIYFHRWTLFAHASAERSYIYKDGNICQDSIISLLLKYFKE